MQRVFHELSDKLLSITEASKQASKQAASYKQASKQANHHSRHEGVTNDVKYASFVSVTPEDPINKNPVVVLINRASTRRVSIVQFRERYGHKYPQQTRAAHVGQLTTRSTEDSGPFGCWAPVLGGGKNGGGDASGGGFDAGRGNLWSGDDRA
ncbi:hypothetical protein M0804_011529 [Polistes exclamans]|nr:hypothetical protein M0804_011529 [Polistes exclamans]